MRRRGLLLLLLCLGGRDVPQAASTFGRLRLLVGTHTWRLPLSIELRYAPAEGSRSSARLASMIAPATCPTCATCPTEGLARLALALALSGLGLGLGLGWG